MHPRAPITGSLLMLLLTGCMQQQGIPIQFQRLQDDLLEGAPRWEVVSVGAGTGARVAVACPSHDQITDSGDRLALILPPPGEVRFSISEQDGPVFLRAAAGVDLALARRLQHGAAPVQVEFEVLVNGERRAGRRVEVRHSTATGELVNHVYHNSWASFGEQEIGLQPGDEVRLRTALVSAPEAELGEVPAAFGSLRLEKRVTRHTRPASAAHPNLVLVVMDTERQDRTTPYGYGRGTTPNLERLARRGLVFDAAYAASSWTWPSMASMLTGRAPTAHGVRVHQNGFLSYEFETLAEALQDEGLRTGAFLGNPLVSDTHNYNQGFEVFHTRLKLSKGDKVIPQAIQWLERNGDQRFFLYVHLTDPHAPHMPSQEELERFTDYTQHLVPPNHLAIQTLLLKSALPPGSDGFPQWEQLLRKGEKKWYSDVYDASVHQGDRWLGELLDALARLGHEQHTIVVYTADHGEELLDHRNLGHGHELWQELVKVPLILAGPGIPAGKRVETPVSNRHLGPTLARLGGAELDAPGGWPFLADPEALRARPVFFETHEGWWKGGTSSIYGVRDGEWVLHWCVDDTAAGESTLPTGGEVRLFHLGRDPHERQDLSATEPAQVQRLKRLIAAELKRWSAEAPRQKERGGGGTRALMQAMGYAGDTEDE